MKRLEMKNSNIILTEKEQKYQHSHREKLINMNILQVNKFYPQIKEESQNKISLLILLQEKLQKNKEKKKNNIRLKQVEALKALKPKGNLKSLKPEESKELESIKGVFPKNVRTKETKNEIDEIKKHEEKI